MPLTVEVDELIDKHFQEQDAKIAELEERVRRLQIECTKWEQRFRKIKNLRDTIVDTAYAVDEWFGD